MLAAAPYVIWEMRLWLDYSIGFVIMLTVSTLLSTAPRDTSHKPGQQPTIIFYPALMSSTYSIIRFFKNMCTVYRRGQMKLECTLLILGTIASCHNRRRQSLHFSSSLHRISALTFNFWQQIPLLMSPNVRLEPSLFGTHHRVNPFN